MAEQAHFPSARLLQLKLMRAWRIARTAASFVLFAVLSAVLSFVLLPLVNAGGSRGRDPVLRSQYLVHRCYWIFVSFMEAVGLIEIRWSGLDRLERAGPLLAVANHPSLIDTSILVSRLPQVDNIVEVSWAENPLMRRCVESTAYLRNDEGPRVVEESVQRLAAGRVLLLFPEGTRSPEFGVGPFQRGAARIAIRSGVALLPIVIRADPPFLKKGQKWHDVADRPMVFDLRIEEPISAASFLDGGESPALAARKVTDGLRAYFLTRLEEPTDSA